MDSLCCVLQVQIFLHLSTSSLSQFAPQSPYAFVAPGMSGMMPMPMGDNMNPFQRSMTIMGMSGQKKSYHSKSSDKNRKKKNKSRRSGRKHKRVHASDSSDTSSSADDYRRSKTSSRRSNQLQNVGKQRQRQTLTPIVSYVTQDGYVVYQKRITKKNPSDWLDVGNAEKSLPPSLEEIIDDSHEDDNKVRFLKRTRSARTFSHIHNI